MYTLKEAEPLLGLKRARIMQLIAAGELKTVKQWDEQRGPRRYVSASEIERFRTARAAEIAETEGRGRRPKLPPGEKAS